jgi:serine/threonine protein kinase
MHVICNSCDVSCSGYIPPECLGGSTVISSKFDVFSLGVVIINIMTGPKAYFRIDDMSSQEFIELVRELPFEINIVDFTHKNVILFDILPCFVSKYCRYMRTGQKG